jgi:hypothetical protein
MTYPPQPPGPPQGPYGPPPPGGPQDPYNQGPYGQDPYNQGPYGQDPYNQGPYNQGPNPYQQQQPWAAGPPGYPMGPPPKKPRTGLIATLIIVAILVVGGGGVGLYLLLNKDDAGEGSGQGGGEGGGARAAAQTYVVELEKTLNTPPQDIDLAKLKPVTCGDDFARMQDELADAKDTGQSRSAEPGAEHKIRIRMKDFERTSDGATFTMTERVSGVEDTESKNMTVAKEDGDWKVCGAYGKDQSGGGSGDSGGGDSGGDGSSPSNEIPPNPIPTT